MDNFKIIAAVKNDEDFKLALDSKVNTIFHLSSNVLKIKKQANLAHFSGKKLFIHVDFAEGIAKDLFGMKILKMFGVDGIISTNGKIIKYAKEEGLLTVQRFFIIDSRSIDSTVESVKQSKPNMIEIMPGVVTKVISRLKENISIPIIAGGLIETCEEVEEALELGIYKISTGCKQLWN